MNKYWSKQYGKYGIMPITWEGWALFAITIGLATQTNNFIDDATSAAIAAGVIVLIGFGILKWRKVPNEIFDKEKDKDYWKSMWGALVGAVILFGLIIGVGGLKIKYSHSTIGYPIRIENEPTWFEFHAIKD